MKDKIVMSIRVSSKKQEAKLQLKDCLEFCKKKDFEVIKIFSEIASAGKSKQKQIHEAEKLCIKEKANLVVWKYDRPFRNKKDFVDFMLRFYESHNLKVYSVQEEWVNMLWEIGENIDYDKIPYPFNESVREDLKAKWKLMIKIIGKMAEDEIRDKGSRVRNAVVKKKGTITKSYKGNIWGRSALPIKTQKEIIQLHQDNPTMSIRELADSIYYWDKNAHKKFVSKSAVHKLISNKNQSNGGFTDDKA